MLQAMKQPGHVPGGPAAPASFIEYLLYVPRSYDLTKPTPLVISIHAAALWPATQMETSQWNKVADEHGFIVVYPSGTTLRGGGTGVLPKVWQISGEAPLLENVRFISELIDKLEAAYNIDPTRIYADVLQWWSHDLCVVLQAFPSNCRGWNGVGGSRPTAVGLVCRLPTGATDQLSWNIRSCSVQRRSSVGVYQTVSERLDMDGELGSKKPMRTEPHRICGGGGCHAPRVHELCE